MNRVNLFFVIMILLLNVRCKSQEIDITDNLAVKITQHTTSDYKYFCHYLDFEIINNNNFDIYMPVSGDDYFSIFNEKDIDISSIVTSFEDQNIYENDGRNKAYENYLEEIAKDNSYFKISANLNLEEIKNKLIDDDYKYILKLGKIDNVDSKLIGHAKDELFWSKFGGVILIPAKSSIVLHQGINYLFGNYILDENSFVFNHEVHTISKPSPSFPDHMRFLFENYEKNRTNEVKVVFNYHAKSPSWDTDSIEFPLSYLDENSEEVVKISKEFPKIILGKYHLVDRLHSLDSLMIDLTTYKNK